MFKNIYNETNESFIDDILKIHLILNKLNPSDCEAGTNILTRLINTSTIHNNIIVEECTILQTEKKQLEEKILILENQLRLKDIEIEILRYKLTFNKQ